jgi:hypothetical protein
LGLGSLSTYIGIDLSEGSLKIGTLESQVLGTTPLYDKNGKRVNFNEESLASSPEHIDKIIDIILKLRSITKNTLSDIFKQLPETLFSDTSEMSKNIENVFRTLSNGVADMLKLDKPTEEQIQETLRQFESLKEQKPKIKNYIDKNSTSSNYMSVWAFAISLYLLTYLTFAHESTARYPLKNKGDIGKGNIGCDDYDENLGIVNRIARVGYTTSLTLNEMKNELKTIEFIFRT